MESNTQSEREVFHTRLELANGLHVDLVAGPPEGDVLVASSDAFGSEGPLNQRISAAAGIDEELRSFFRPPVTLKSGKRCEVLFVQVIGDAPTAELIRVNLLKGLELFTGVAGQVLYLPLLGTGSGQLTFGLSAEALLDALTAWQQVGFRLVLLGAPNEEAAQAVASVWRKNALQLNARGPAVRILQEGLGVPADGEFGKATDQAVRAFQQEVGLIVDGVVGPATWAELKRKRPVVAPGLPSEPMPNVTRHQDNDLPNALALATHLAKLANRAGGADAGLLFAACCLIDPDVLEVIGAATSNVESPAELVLKHYGITSLPARPESGWAALSPEPELDAEASEVLRRARSLEVRVSMEENVFIALLADPSRGGPKSVAPVLEALGTTGRQARSRIMKEAERQTPRIRATLRSFLAEWSPRVAERAAYANDRPDGPDLLNIEDDVNALADVIAAAERSPPLAVGLFGDWGSGKSFFISKLKQRLTLLADCAKEAQKARKPTTYCRRIVHVDFNAWQYADGNLWANLVHRVFEQLSSELFGTPTEENAAALEKQRKMLFEKLAMSREQLAENEQLKVAAEKVHKDAEARRLELEEQRDEAAKKLTLPNAQAVVKEVLKLPETASRVQEFRDAWEHSSGGDVVRDLQQAHTQLSTFWGRTTEALRRFRKQGPVHLALVALALATILVVAFASRHAGGIVESARSLGGVGALLAMIGSGLARLTSFQKQAEEVLEIVEKAQTSVEKGLNQQQRLLAKQQANAQREVSEASLQLLRVEEERQRSAQRVNELETQIDSISSGHRLRDFIRARSGGADYRQHLGIVSAIRSDFENLKGLLAEVQRDDSVEGTIPIERIVLYVDDLDRCPADRVVEVLQAVHLLLDFPLFVAVVAVDARWLLKSLASAYSTQLVDPARGRDAALWASTPQNFLEKIFQIPFAVRPIDETGYQDLVRGLLPVHEPQAGAAKEEKAEGKAEEGKVKGAEGKGAEGKGANGAKEKQGGDSAAKQLTLEPKKHSHTNGGTTEYRLHAINANPETLQVRLHERELLERFSRLVTTPRAVKRLINLYWLTRASLRQHELDEFVGTPTSPGTCATHQFLLATMVGYPALADRFFESLSDVSIASLSDAITTLTTQTEKDPEAAQWKAFCTRVTEVAKLAKLPTAIDDYLEPVRRVRRFSFRSDPGEVPRETSETNAKSRTNGTPHGEPARPSDDGPGAEARS